MLRLMLVIKIQNLFCGVFKVGIQYRKIKKSEFNFFPNLRSIILSISNYNIFQRNKFLIMS